MKIFSTLPPVVLLTTLSIAFFTSCQPGNEGKATDSKASIGETAHKAPIISSTVNADTLSTESTTAVDSDLPSEEQLKAGAPAYLRGMWRGKIGKKPLTLQIEQVQGQQVSGWNQVGNNRRPVKGTYWAWVEDGACGFGLKLQEPGDDKWDGAFDLQITSKDGGALNINHCYGIWKANNGKLSNDVQLGK
jgi:hypothetical protein